MIEHEREIYGILNLMGDIGGIHDISIFALSLFLIPLARHSFNLKAISKMYLIKISD